jgi:GTP-binding protein
MRLNSHSYLKGRTRALDFYNIGDPGKLVLVDAPGYGARGKVEWGKIFEEYIETREQYAFSTNYVALNQTFFFPIRLKRIYILFTAKHGLNAFDHQMLTYLSQKLVTPRGTQPFTLQAIITKADLVRPEELPTNISLIQKAIWEHAPLCLPAIITSTALNPHFQIDLVQKNIADVCGLL